MGKKEDTKKEDTKKKKLCKVFTSYVDIETEKLWEKICDDIDGATCLPRLNKISGYSTTSVKIITEKLAKIGWHGVMYKTATSKFILFGDEKDINEIREEVELVKGKILSEF